ncbi:auxin-responsive protein IAA5-like isoform X2 [Salvia miltiorrhiza]|uniref:auxin-responsive protein IAA5-like isoform X2 n=1 Tax=Salvia miltiorrhiza TaxID=226208 RepID=UPI0025AD4DBD|nr:auxin-responsive protein IAA5-like isoform X2 [Salvia miltiorrhiza]
MKIKMDDLQLHLSLSNTNSTHNEKKRKFDESFSDDITDNKRTLPLLIWDSINSSRCVDVEEDVMVGWPPVKSWKKKLAGQHHRESSAANYITVEKGGGGSNYVKVEMDGIGIARKIDLSIHPSYQALTATLMPMFGKRPQNLKMYNLTYQDKDGDWLLAGDVPWERFVGSVRRLKLLRKEW